MSKLTRREQAPGAQPLWTKDFTIITLGSVVSMIGGSMSGFAFSLFVLDYTGSTFLYAQFMVLYTAPQLIMPVVGGAVMDRFSRRKTIYTLDFTSTGLYLLMGTLTLLGRLSFGLLAAGAFLIGCINSVYTVAYQSLYPMLITEGNFSRAYSIASVLETVAMLSIPVATLVYNAVGMGPLLFINAACFFTAACFETRISAVEPYIAEKGALGKGARERIAALWADTREGIAYLREEKGLLAIASYMSVSAIAGGVVGVITLPYFRANFANGEYVYQLVWGASTLCRAVGGFFGYRFRIPPEKKTLIALGVYVTVDLIDAFYLFVPLPVMLCMTSLEGLLAVTSYNIRLSAVQSYVPDDRKGRFNGAFNLLNTIGSLTGELLAGALTVFLPARGIQCGTNLLIACAAVLIIGGRRKDVEKVYNRDA